MGRNAVGWKGIGENQNFLGSGVSMRRGPVVGGLSARGSDEGQ